MNTLNAALDALAAQILPRLSTLKVSRVTAPRISTFIVSETVVSA